MGFNSGFKGLMIRVREMDSLVSELKKKTGIVRINVILMRVRVTIVTMEKQLVYTF